MNYATIFDKYSNNLYDTNTRLINLAYMKFANICVYSIKIIYKCLSGAFLFLLGIYSNMLFMLRCCSMQQEANQKYRGMFKTQKSGNKISSGEIRIHASPKVGQDQVSGGVSVLCWHVVHVDAEGIFMLYNISES